MLYFGSINIKYFYLYTHVTYRYLLFCFVFLLFNKAQWVAHGVFIFPCCWLKLPAVQNWISACLIYIPRGFLMRVEM